MSSLLARQHPVVWQGVSEAVSRFREAVDAGDLRRALIALRHAEHVVDMAVAKGVVRVRSAALIKSAMAVRAARAF